MSQPHYSIEFWEHGISISGPPGKSGVPIQAVAEQMPKVAGRDAVLCPGIAHHLKVTGHPNVVVVAGKKEAIEEWRREIEVSLANHAPEERWFFGTEVGSSSASIFAACATNQTLADAAAALGKGACPSDPDDFRRCHQLLEHFPEWKAELHKVAERFPQSRWKMLVDQWDALEEKFVSGGKELTEALQKA